MSACNVCGKCPCYEHERKTVATRDGQSQVLELTREASEMPHVMHCEFNTGGKCSCSLFWRQLFVTLQARASESAQKLAAAVERAERAETLLAEEKEAYGIQANLAKDQGRHAVALFDEVQRQKRELAAEREAHALTGRHLAAMREANASMSRSLRHLMDQLPAEAYEPTPPEATCPTCDNTGVYWPAVDAGFSRPCPDCSRAPRPEPTREGGNG